MKKNIVIMLMFFCIPFVSLFGDGPYGGEWEVIEIINPEEVTEDVILQIQVLNSMFKTLPIPNVEITVTLVFVDSSTKSRNFTSNNSGQLFIVYPYKDKNKISSIYLNSTNNIRFYFKNLEIKYPYTGIYELLLSDRFIDDIITHDEYSVFNKYTIIMKKSFIGKDIDDRTGWKYLLEDENIKYDTEKALKENNFTLEKYIDYIFQQQNNTLRSELWKKYTNRIKDGNKNYINMLNSESMKKNITGVIFYNIKAPDNIYISYISANIYDSKEIDKLLEVSKGLDKWKRTSGKEIGYIYYDSNVYYNTYIKFIYETNQTLGE